MNTYSKFFYFIVFLIPFSFATNPTSSIDLSVIRILIPLLFLTWLIVGLKNRKIIIDTRLRFFLLLLFLFVISLSFFWAIDQTRALRKILFFFSFFPIYFVSYALNSEKNNHLKTLKILFWSSFILTVLSLIQFFSQFLIGLDQTLKIMSQTTAPFFLGQAFSEMVLAYPSWLVNIGGKTILRATGSFPDPHLFSLFLNFSLPLFFYLYIKNKKIIYLIGCFLMLSASLLSFSRASYLALIMGSIFSLILFGLFKYFVKKPVLISIVIAFFALLVITPNPVSQRFHATFDLSEKSNSERVLMWEKAGDTFLKYPLTGVGIGNFSRYVNPDSDLRDPTYAHNLFLDFAAEAGLFSLSILILLLLTPFYQAIKTPSLFNKFLAVSFLIFIVHCFFETPFYSVRILPLFLIFLSFHVRNN